MRHSCTHDNWPNPSVTNDLIVMPLTYTFKDSKTSDTVAKALLYVSRFTKKQALVRFSDNSVGIIWGGSLLRGLYINSGVSSLSMFNHSNQPKHYGIDHCTIFQVDPQILGRTLRSSGGHQDRSVSISVSRATSKLQVQVAYNDKSRRIMTHTIPCDIKTVDDYKAMSINEVVANFCRFHTGAYVDNIHRLRHVLDSFVRLNTSRVYIWSRQTPQESYDLTITAKTQGSSIRVNLSDLEDGTIHGYEEDITELEQTRRTEAGIKVDTKKLATFLSGLSANRRSKVQFEIEHNKVLRVTLENEVTHGEKIYQSILLLHIL